MNKEIAMSNSNLKSKKPEILILLLEDHEKELKRISGLFKKEIKQLQASYGIKILPYTSSKHALDEFYSNGDIQAILMDWYLDEPGQEDVLPNERKSQVPSRRELVLKFKEHRPEVNVYVMTVKKSGMQVIDECPEISSFFSKKEIENKLPEVFGKIVNDLEERIKTPFWTEYKKYIESAKDSWHTPGHSGGTSFSESPYLREFYDFFGANYFRGDLSVSVEKLGSLLDSSGPIGDAQEVAKRSFRVARTFFATNGSSTSNKIILQTLLRPNDKIIVDRNCHKSVHYGIMVAGAIPIYLKSEYSSKYGIFAPPKIAEIKNKIEKNPDAKLLVLTGCTYEGLLLNLKEVVNIARKNNVKVFVDEAWFAYSYYHPRLRQYSAVAAGAHYITHSAHKVLSSFSQASLIHVNDPDFDEDLFREIFYIYTSTSPQYTMIASLDVARMQMEMEGYKIIEGAIKLASDFRDMMHRNTFFRIVEEQDFLTQFQWLRHDGVGYDPLKVLVDFSNSKMNEQQVHTFLKQIGGVEIEKTTHSTFLVLFTIGATASRVARLYKAIQDVESQCKKTPPKKPAEQNIVLDEIPVPEVGEPPRNSFYAPYKQVDIDKSKDLKAARMVTPYPPGIPILVPGQVIRQEHIDFLLPLIDAGREIHGCRGKKIYVVDIPKEIANSQLA
jgi:lysine decarboxylase/arginine decarboxylase